MAKTRVQQRNWLDVFNELEGLVMNGQHARCRENIDAIPPSKYPRELASKFASLATRIHHSIYALKVLNRYVAPVNRFDGPPTSQEKLIYAYALSNLGALEEAIQIFDTIDPSEEPEMLILKSFAFFGQWKYHQALPLLRDFINSPELPPYRRLVGEVNLVAAYIGVQKFAPAILLLDRIQRQCMEGRHHLLLGNAFELEAQIYFFQGKYSKALECLQRAEVILKDQEGLYLAFVDKWTAICRAFESKTPNDRLRLSAFRGEALKADYWETCRDIDLFESVLTQDENLARKVIMGTPSEMFRQRARTLFGKTLRPVGIYRWKLGPDTFGSSAEFDPYEKLPNGRALYKNRQLLALFNALTEDFYKPCYVGHLFKAVYPDEKFNPYTSPTRVFRLLKRLDHWLQSENIPLRVRFKKSEFAIEASVPIEIIVRRGQEMSASVGKWSEIKKQVKDRPFSTAKICSITGDSHATALRLVRQGIEDGKIHAIGQGRSKVYQFAQNGKGGKKNTKMAA